MPRAQNNEPMNYILVLNIDLKSGAKSYKDMSVPKRYEFITPPNLKKIKECDILYVSTHGVHSQDGKYAENEIVTDEIGNLKGIGGFMKADAFCEFLTDAGLPDVTIKLKIFACFSADLTQSDNDTLDINNSFAGQVASLLNKTRPRITVYGYLDELKFAPVIGEHKSGGTRLNDPQKKLFRAKDKRYEFALDGSIIGPDGSKLKLKEQRWL
jgi:hypothetical protein